MQNSLLSKIYNVYTGNHHFITHVNPDVDAIFSLVIIYWKLRDLFPQLTPVKFINNYVLLVPANAEPNLGDFGVDIGPPGVSHNHVKNSDTPIVIGNTTIGQVCCSMYMAHHLLSHNEFDALHSVIAEINSIDAKGMKKEQHNDDPLSAIHPTSIWGILGAVQRSNTDFKDTFVLAEQIFLSFLQFSLSENANIARNYWKVEKIMVTNNLDKKSEYMIAIPPINSGRAVVSRCFRNMRAKAVIFHTLNKETGEATVGITLARSLSTHPDIDLTAILQYDEMSEFTKIRDLFVTQHVIGRTDKAPFMSDKETLTKYVTMLKNAMIKFFKDVVALAYLKPNGI